MVTDKDVNWQYDEFHQVGVDYGQKDIVEKYDSRHSDFRDMEAESHRVLETIGIRESDILIDFGSGTGTFAILAAKQCKKVLAVDVSQAMIEYAKSKAMLFDVSNIEFHQAGFLTYEHKESPVDSIVTSLAFHHLPDLWKGVALKRMSAMLKPGGLLYLHDVILQEDNVIENIGAFIDTLAAKGGAPMKVGTERHFKEEFSTYDWVMDGMLTRSGFSIEKKQIDNGVLGTYLCLKK